MGNDRKGTKGITSSFNPILVILFVKTTGCMLKTRPPNVKDSSNKILSNKQSQRANKEWSSRLEAGWTATLIVESTRACTFTCSKISPSSVDRYKFKRELTSQLWHGKGGEDGEARVHTERTQSLLAISILRLPLFASCDVAEAWKYSTLYTGKTCGSLNSRIKFHAATQFLKRFPAVTCLVVHSGHVPILRHLSPKATRKVICSQLTVRNGTLPRVSELEKFFANVDRKPDEKILKT